MVNRKKINQIYMIKEKLLTLTITLLTVLCTSFSFAQTNQPDLPPDGCGILHKVIYDIHAKQTFTATVTEEYQLFTLEGINDNKQYQIGFFPDSEKIDWITATIIQPSGATLKVPKENIRIQPAFTSISAASLSNRQVMTITFPQLRLGSKVLIHYQLTSSKPPQFGFNIADQPIFPYPDKKRVIVLNFPKSLAITVSQRGGYTIKHIPSKDNMKIVAELTNSPRHYEQSYRVADQDILPLFSASSAKSWQEIGDDYWQKSKDKIIVNQEIKDLAQHIVGDKKGLAAAKAIYNWVIANIYYVSIDLNNSDSMVPKSSSETLSNRYGDCKAIVVLLQALYKAVGIDSQPVLIGWNNSYKPFPSANLLQFNHAILYLPEYQQFINSTDPYSPFGVLGKGLQNKLAIIASDKSLVTQTPEANPQENTYQINQVITVQADGTLQGESHLETNGTIGTEIRRKIAYSLGSSPLQTIANETLKNTLYGGFGKFFISDLENLNRPLTIEAIWHSPQAINMEKQLFLLLPQGLQPISINGIRDLVFEDSIQYPISIAPTFYRWHDTISVPLDYHMQSLPHSSKISNSAGSYSSQYKLLSPSKIELVRTLILKKNYYSPETYKDLKTIALQAAHEANTILYFTR